MAQPHYTPHTQGEHFVLWRHILAATAEGQGVVFDVIQGCCNTLISQHGAPRTKNYPAQNVASAEGEKPCFVIEG